MQIDILAQIAISGVLIGGLYALFSFGLSLIYGVARILNFAHGTLLAMAAIVASMIHDATGWHPIILLLIVSPAFFAFGWGFHRLLLAPLRHRNAFEAGIGTVLVTVGGLIIMSDVAATIAGARPRNIPIRSEVIEFGNILIPTTQAYTLLGIVALTICLHIFLQKSWFGRAIRAVTQDHVGASICGVKSDNVHALTFAMGSALAALAGVLYALSFPIDPYSGFSLTVRAFTIIVLGGIGNLIGALLAGVVLGMSEAYVAFFFGTEWSPAISVILLLAILLIFPNGLRVRRQA